MDYTPLITYMLVMTITPGPNNIMLATTGANFGYRACVPHIAGICVGGSVQFLLVCFGLGAVFTEFPILHTLLSWCGLVYMFYLAWQLVGAKIKDKTKTGRPINFIEACLFQFVNLQKRG